MKVSSIFRLLMALVFVGCGVAAAAFALMEFGATARTVPLGIAAVTAGGLVAGVADNAVVSLLRGDGDQLGRAYGDLGKVAMVLGALLPVSVVILLGQVMVAVFRAVSF